MQLIWLILAAPLAGSILLLAAGRRLGRSDGALASLAIATAFVATLVSWIDLLGQHAGSRSELHRLFTWAVVGPLEVGIDVRWDPLAAVMALVVTGVGFLIHVYSIGYMADDPRRARFFAYLNLFVFSMLVLVLADNLVFLFAGWELVGLCSYLLIGFWFERPQAATAAKKAFLTTRIGDTGMLIGLFLVFSTLGTLQIPQINRAVTEGELAGTTATVAALLLFAGAVGKSAQVPLYVWLPDAMEGPTPVSALIHAATMVTAGVYLVVRLNPLFNPDIVPVAALTVAIVGVVTAVYAAILATAEPDIKRVLAYSTVSQLGFMFLAAGVGAFGVAIFHLATHAFFKALLFLAAGSLMHGLAGETALDRMGGLRRVMPWTFAMVLVGWGAITGVLPFSGFFSKDEIVANVWAQGRTGLFAAAVVAAGLTAFYMSRLLFLAFWGRPRWSEGTHPHESPAVMIAPMTLLAVLAVIGGAMNHPFGLPGAHALDRFLGPVAGPAHHPEGIGIVALLWGVAVAGAAFAWWVYGIDPERRVAVRSRLGPLYTLARNRFFVDEIYATLIVSPARLVAAFCAFFVDLRVIDGAVNGAGTVVAKAAGSWRRLQTGLVRSYAAGVFLGAGAIVVYVVLRVAG